MVWLMCTARTADSKDLWKWILGWHNTRMCKMRVNQTVKMLQMHIFFAEALWWKYNNWGKLECRLFTSRVQKNR